MRLFIRTYGSSFETEAEDCEIISEAEANALLGNGESPDKIRELIPIKTDIKQVKQLAII